MGRWWRNYIVHWAGPMFPMLLMQLVVWLAMAVVWTWGAVTSPDGWRIALSIGSVGLALCWSITTVAVLRYRNSQRAR